MKLNRVTITGADDSVDQITLSKLSEKYPFVEWGILYSKSRQGYPRYPSVEWLHKFQEIVEPTLMKLSAHLCGRWVRDLVLDGRFTFAKESPMWSLYKRIQLNFHGQFHKGHEGWTDELMRHPEKQYILQYDGVNDKAASRLLHMTEFSTAPLFDKSGGAGVLPHKWPLGIPNIYCGYAGGLGPKNLEGEILKIGKAAGDADVWIDMETRVRSNDDSRFDLEKVETCLRIAEEFVT